VDVNKGSLSYKYGTSVNVQIYIEDLLHEYAELHNKVARECEFIFV
jgi:hypothetical protein